MSNYEIKTTHFEIKEITDEGVITGYGAVFDTVDQGGDIILPKAFDRSLKSGKSVKMLWQHYRDNPIGIWTELKADNYGLLLKGQINLEIQQGRETLSLLKQGALDGLSIGFIPMQADHNANGDRELKEVNLKEVSIVTFPMNEAATVISAKNETADMTVDQLKEVSEFIRELTKTDEEVKEEVIAHELADLLDEMKNEKTASDLNSIINKTD